MFDFSWSELMVIGLVALIFIGPKDMPVALRAISRVLKKLRRMAGEFQGHLDEMMREADLQEVSTQLRELRSTNLKSTMARMVDPDGSLNRAMTEPFMEPKPARPAAPASPLPERSIAPGPAFTGPEAPAFIPPGSPPPAPIQPIAEAPSFVPPEHAGSPASGQGI